MNVLDVGVAHGWFLEAVALAGARAEDVEPDERIAASARARGLVVTTGYFPGAVPDMPAFDAICFRDILEHIVDPSTALLECRRLLAPGGLLVVSAPDTVDAPFAIARLLAVVGLYRPLERFWQVGEPSLHVSYFR